VTRQSTDGAPRDGWVGSQRIGVEDALRAWTVNGAYASFDNRARGKLRFGMEADLVVLSQDLFEIGPSDIWKTHVDMTVFDGQVVYTRQ
jgi:predicted amidohydrolase YtcJ